MSTTFPIGAFSVPNTQTVLGPDNIPVGTTSASLTLDVSQMTPGQVLWMKIEHSDGTNWFFDAEADFDGPYTNKQGQTVNINSLTVTLGAVAQSGWQVRATVWAVNGPISIPSGTLVLS